MQDTYYSKDEPQVENDVEDRKDYFANRAYVVVDKVFYLLDGNKQIMKQQMSNRCVLIETEIEAEGTLGFHMQLADDAGAVSG